MPSFSAENAKTHRLSITPHMLIRIHTVVEDQGEGERYSYLGLSAISNGP